MKWIFTILILSSLFSFVENENKQPDWLQEMIDGDSKTLKITECTWDKQTVWKVNPCTICNDMITKVYDEKKNIICEYGGVLRKNTCQDNDIFFEDCKVIYKPKMKLQMGISLD